MNKNKYKHLFPFYKNDGEPLFIYKKSIKEAVGRINTKIKNGTYKHVSNDCLCGKTNDNTDYLIAEKDMWGIAAENVICSNCGLVRSKYILDNKSLTDFYETDYKFIYYDSPEPNDFLFNSQSQRGQQFLSLINSCNLTDKIQNVFDYGCGMGGTLSPFLKIGKNVSGCDYGKNYIEFGSQKGISGLYHGELDNNLTSNESQDLVILSHVFEHFTNPTDTLQKILEIVQTNKFLLIEVPGVFADAPYGYYPIWHLQKGHITNFFYKDFLKNYFEKLGLNIIYSDERCTFILEKPTSYRKLTINNFYSESLKKYPDLVIKRFLDSYEKFDKKKWKNKIRIAKFIIGIANRTYTRPLLSLFFKESKDWTL